MSAPKRWFFAILGAAGIVILILGLFLGGTYLAHEMVVKSCMDRDGRWDHTERRCYLPSKPKDR